jgi:hypothetical protein
LQGCTDSSHLKQVRWIRSRIRPEEEAVLLCCLETRSQAQQDRLCRLLTDGERLVDRFWTEAAEQQVTPLVALVLTSSPFTSALPTSLIEQAKSSVRATAFRNLAQHAELIRVANALFNHGIPAVPLKGSHLAERLLGMVGARLMSDIDVIVPEAQILEGQSVLRDLGYHQPSNHGQAAHPFHGIPWFREEDGQRFVVELHWKLSNPRFVTIDYDQFWRRVRTHSSDHEALRPLPSEETLVYLALHLAKHDIGILRLVVDIDRLVRREGRSIDWGYVVLLAKQWSVDAMLYFALMRAHILLGCPLPTQAMKQLQPMAWRGVLVDLLAGPKFALRPPKNKDNRYARFMLSYCAMITPLQRSLDAYLHHFYGFPDNAVFNRPGSVVTLSYGLLRGSVYTLLGIAQALQSELAEYFGSTAQAVGRPAAWSAEAEELEQSRAKEF